jgi:hypothetical protein
VFALFLLAQATDCSWNAVGWSCRQQQTAPLDYGKLMQSGRDMVPAYRPPDPEVVRQYRADALRRAVGKLVNDGKCADAQGLAVKNGDFGLANEVKAYCASQ